MTQGKYNVIFVFIFLFSVGNNILQSNYFLELEKLKGHTEKCTFIQALKSFKDIRLCPEGHV